ncbi:MAG: ComEC/Rec2 family competence protein [Hyphomicrobiales bacterium]|nr:ComEC/Rec2 family competence protein [Hyphomicrobiales bacterium]
MTAARRSPKWRSGRRQQPLGVRLAAFAREALSAEQDRWFLWTPVLLAAGVAVYFALPREPSLAALGGLALLLAACAWRARAQALLFLGLASLGLFAAGMGLAKLRADMVAAPVLGETLVSALITGWVETAEARRDGRLRLQLRVAGISRLDPEETPRRVLVSLRQGVSAAFAPGDAVRLRAFVQPPPPAPAPGAYDFARTAYFEGIGGVGVAHGTPESWAEAPPAPLLSAANAAIDRLRAGVAARIRASLAGEAGILATALITGLRAGIPEDILESLRASGLAHILAISGLHMTLMAGSLFWLARAGLAAVPTLALRHPIKKMAASLALAGATFYLALSGASVATQRAYVMIAIMLAAVLLERPAITMRNVALAAIAVIVLRPESVLSASFQMSFAAAVSLIAAYEYRLARLRLAPEKVFAARAGGLGLLRLVVFYFAAIALTTLVASAATAPFAAYHFQRVAPYSLLGNLAAMPAVGLLVMPAGLMSVIAMPFGLEPVPLHAMGLGIDWVLAAARAVAALPGAETHIAQVSAAGLLVMVFGVLWLVLWHRPWRLAGLAAIAAAIPLALVARGPDVLIDANAASVAVRGGEGGQFSVMARNTDSFTVSRWLESDGDDRPAEEIDDAAFSCDPEACIAGLPGGGHIAIVKHVAALEEECRRARIVVLKFDLSGRCDGPEMVFDKRDLQRHGAHAVWIGSERLTLRRVRPIPGARPWEGAAPADEAQEEATEARPAAETGPEV